MIYYSYTTERQMSREYGNGANIRFGIKYRDRTPEETKRFVEGFERAVLRIRMKNEERKLK